MIVERIIQKIYPGKRGALDAIDERFAVVEGGLGFPSKKRFSSISSMLDNNSIVIEREWESLAAMEAAYGRAYASAEQQALYAEMDEIVKSSRIELYMPT